MVTALYRRYRPETFTELIGQAQVTDPLRTALRTDRVGHAYLFSGPRGCGKTTSARILARCLNCAQGPTDTPCGECASCRELARDGGGSLDVIEIDAASHNGVDDARDLRDRAAFAPARDRYKIFILDEAHMVTPQGFNALLKIVEEPPEHVKFIFATTEPEKVIGTIRSRTHHYPFRLVPPALMLDYVQKLTDEEGMHVAPGVLPLVVRAGGGSPRDTLSLLDQLIAGSEGDEIGYERAVALLGYTHSALLDEVIKFRKEQADRYEEYLKKIADLIGKVQAGHADDTPEPLKRSAGLRAIYDNLRLPPAPAAALNLQDEVGPLPMPDPKLKLAVDIDEAVKRERHADWRGNAARENHIKREALLPLLGNDVTEVERIFDIIKQQPEY